MPPTAAALKKVIALVALFVGAPVFAQTMNNWATWTLPSSYPYTTTGGALPSTYAAGATGSIVNPIGGATIGLTLSGEVNSYSRTNSSNWTSVYPAGTTVAGTYLSPQVTTAPAGAMITQTGYTTTNLKAHTLTFSSTVSDVLMSIWSLGGGSSLSALRFSQPFQILSSNGNTSYGGNSRFSSSGDATSGYTLSGYEGNGVIQFLGSYNSISWNVTAPEFYSGFNIGMTNNPVTGYGSVTPYAFPGSELPTPYGSSSNSSTPDIVSANNRTGSNATGFNLLSNVAAGSTFNNRFNGGTLKVDSNNASSNATFTITANKGYIDQSGNISTFSGVISNDGTDSGRLVILNSAGSLGLRAGRVILSAANTYSGGTEVQAGASLEIASASALGTGQLDLVGSATESATLIVTASTTINNNITVAGDPTFDIASGTTTTVNGVIADGSTPGDVVKTGAGELILAGTNTYTGPTTVSQGALTVSGSLSDSTAVTVASGATYNVNASDTIGSLAGAGTVSSSNAGARVLTAGADNTSTTFSGVIQDGTGSLGLAKTGSGTMTLSGVNTYTGPTTISAGTLALVGSGSIANSSAVINTATFNVTGVSSNVALGGTYTQSSVGTLKMSMAPVSNQQINVVGASSLSGTLDLTASTGNYHTGRYTLITSAGLEGSKFSTFTSNLSSVTPYNYSLGYDANNVYLELRSTAADTMSSIQAVAADLNKVYNAQYGIAQMGLSYDCKLFAENDLCLSTGARVTHSRADGSTYDGVALIVAYRAQPNVRLGGWIDQNESRNMNLNVRTGNSTPMFGAFAVWNENATTSEGLEVKVSAAHGKKDLNITRPVVGTSEKGLGNSRLSTTVAEATLGYGLTLDQSISLQPYAGLRYMNQSNAGYTEGSDIFSPLTFAKNSQSAKSVIAGVKLFGKSESPMGLELNTGVEHFVSTSAAQVSASGLDDLSAVQMTPAMSKNRPFVSASLRFDIAKNQQLLFGLSHTKQFANTGWVDSATVRYVIGL